MGAAVAVKGGFILYSNRFLIIRIVESGLGKISLKAIKNFVPKIMATAKVFMHSKAFTWIKHNIIFVIIIKIEYFF